jgi:hypothetical protein
MFTNKAKTVPEYLSGLPADRKKLVSAVRSLVRKHLPKGYKEEIGWGAINWVVPLSKFPDTYNQKPLCYVALAAQKNYVSLYLMMAYGDPKKYAWLKDQFKKAGKKMDMGKSCLHFNSLDDIPIEAVATLIASHTPAQWIARYETSRRPA